MEDSDKSQFQMISSSTVTLPMISNLARNFYSSASITMSHQSGIHSVAYVTVPSEEVARNISRGLVRNKLAACVNIMPKITSVYEWKGEINEDQELLLMIKTRTAAIDALTKFVKDNHPYEVCEVISLPIQNGNEQYLNWISEVVPPVNETGETIQGS